MSKPTSAPSIDISRWVSEAPATMREFREAVHLTLAAIESDPELRSDMVMKGGILMAIRYHSPRFTKDIDFSTHHTLREIDVTKFEQRFAAALAIEVAESEYDLDCRIQSCKVLPPRKPDATFPSIKLTIGYAAKGSAKHRRLQNGDSPDIVSIDYSLNERILAKEDLPMDGGSIRVYAFSDLVAEKFRSLLQQADRNRYRRQDIYDLNLLLAGQIEQEERSAILSSLLEKSRSRGIEPRLESLGDPEIRTRAEVDYHTLADEVAGKLPEFSTAYTKIEDFYRSLPW